MHILQGSGTPKKETYGIKILKIALQNLDNKKENQIYISFIYQVNAHTWRVTSTHTETHK